MTPTPLGAPARTYPSLRAAWMPMAALCLAFFVEMVDNTLLSIALPTIGRDLGSGTTALQWVTSAYSLTFGGLLLTAGSMADRLGRRRVLLVGLAVFGLLSLGVIAVSDTWQLIVLRGGLGIAAAATPSPARRPMSSPVVETATTPRLSRPNTMSPTMSTRRRP